MKDERPAEPQTEKKKLRISERMLGREEVDVWSLDWSDFQRHMQMGEYSPMRRQEATPQASVPAKRRKASRKPKSQDAAQRIIVEVKAVDEHADRLGEMQSRFESYPQVRQCDQVTGTWDFILVLEVDSMEHYEALTHELYVASANVKAFNTLTARAKAQTG